MREATIGVVGAGGSLGRLVVAALEADGAAVVAVDVRRSDPGQRAELLGTLDALVVVAALPDATLHREALERGCHVVDVGVDLPLNLQLLALDEVARAGPCSLVAMAGLAPGLTGALGANVLDAFAPEAQRVVVALLQSPTGTAGEHGTRDMLDLLTGADVTARHRPVLTAAGTIVRTRLLDLRNAEPDICGLGARLEPVTGFGRAMMHLQLRALRAVRSVVPAAYPPVRDRAARRKARTPGTRETTRLSAVALDAEDRPVGGRLLTVTSDYGATAAVAAATATAAAHARLVPGAGHLLGFLGLDELVALPRVAEVVTHDSGPLAATDDGRGTTAGS